MAQGTPSGFSELEDWLIAIARHTKETKDALERRERDQREDKSTRDSTWMDRLGTRLESAVARGLGIGLASARSLANRGFQGTLESAKLDYAMEQLGRQFAAIMMPVVAGMMYFGARLEAGMRGMNGNAQNRMMGVMTGGMLGGMLGGTRGAIAGALLGPAVMSALGGATTERYDASMSAAGGAYAGFRLGGPVGAVVGGTGGAIAGGGVGDYYRMYRRDTARDLGGDSMLSRAAAGMAAGGAAVFDAATGGSMREYMTRTGRMTPEDRRVGPEAPRRDITPYMPGMTNAGEQHFVMQQQMIRTTAGAAIEDPGPLRPFFDGMYDIIKLLSKIAGVTFVESPRPAVLPAM